MGRERGLRADMGPQIPTSSLPEAARQYTELPFGTRTEANKQYHVRTYERWCAARGIEPWPAELENLLEIAAERGRTLSHSAVSGLVHEVALRERARSGRELLGVVPMRKLLQGVLRDRPPNPVRPMSPNERDRVFAYVPTTRSQRRTRSVLLLTYAAGIGIVEHIALRIEMLEFVEEGLVIRGLSTKRPFLFVGRGTDEQRCPVRGVAEAAYGRTTGALWTSPRTRSELGELSYSGLTAEIRRYGRSAGVTPFTSDRVRMAGIAEQARTIHPVQLAHFLGRPTTRYLSQRFRPPTPTPW